MTEFVDVKINKKHIINLLCKLYQVGAWVELLERKGYEITTIVKVDPVTNQVSPDTWNIVAIRTFIDEERWEGYIG